MPAKTLQKRLRAAWRSFQSLPLWVQIWVGGILIPVNAAAFFLLDYPSGQLTAWAALFVVATNIPIMLMESGMSKLMSLPHLLAWIPLQIALIARLADPAALLPAGEQVFVGAVLLVNGVSLVFDAMDSWHWFCGDHAIPGAVRPKS